MFLVVVCQLQKKTPDGWTVRRVLVAVDDLGWHMPKQMTTIRIVSDRYLA